MRFGDTADFFAGKLLGASDEILRPSSFFQFGFEIQAAGYLGKAGHDSTDAVILQETLPEKGLMKAGGKFGRFPRDRLEIFH